MQRAKWALGHFHVSGPNGSATILTATQLTLMHFQISQADHATMQLPAPPQDRRIVRMRDPSTSVLWGANASKTFRMSPPPLASKRLSFTVVAKGNSPLDFGGRQGQVLNHAE